MVRALGSNRWGVVAVLVALSAGAGLVEATTSVDPEDLFPECDGDMVYFGDGYCDRATLNVEECGYDGGDCCECTCVGDGVDTRIICLEGNYECEDMSAECYVEPSPTPSPVVEPPTEQAEDLTTTADSSSSLSRATSATAAATAAFAVTTLCGAFARALL